MTQKPTERRLFGARLVLGVAALGLSAPAYAETPAPIDWVEAANTQEPDLSLVRFRANYEGYAGGFRLGAVSVEATLGPETYNVNSFLSTRGIVDWFASTDLRTSSEGVVTAGVMRPAVYRMRSITKDSDQRVELRFLEGGGTELWSEPAYNVEKYPVAKSLVADTIDPLSTVMFVALSASASGVPCPANAPVFDGRRRYNLNFTYVGPIDHESRSKKEYSGPAHKCEVRFEQVAGFKPPKRGATPPKPSDLILADITGDGLFAPIRIVVRSRFGATVLRATELSAVYEDTAVILAGAEKETKG